MNTNLTVRDVVRYHVCRCGDHIHALKKACERTSNTGQKYHITPRSAEWFEYQGFRRECSWWLTGIKLLKTDPVFRGGKLESSTAADAESQLCHLTRELLMDTEKKRKERARYMGAVRKRLLQIEEQLVKGSKHTTTRIEHKIDSKTRTSKAVFVPNITYTEKSFEGIAKWKAEREAEFALKHTQAEVTAMKETEHEEALRAGKA
jgi:hypothetical protein